MACAWCEDKCPELVTEEWVGDSRIRAAKPSSYTERISPSSTVKKCFVFYYYYYYYYLPLLSYLRAAFAVEFIVGGYDTISGHLTTQVQGVGISRAYFLNGWGICTEISTDYEI